MIAIHLRRRIALERRYQWGGEVLFYVCAGCQRPHRHLYPWAMIDGRLAQDLNPRCAQCAGLRYLCQGNPGGGSSSSPWYPRAVSDARMVASEFPGSETVNRSHRPSSLRVTTINVQLFRGIRNTNSAGNA